MNYNIYFLFSKIKFLVYVQLFFTIHKIIQILEITNLDNCNKSYGDHLTITIPQKTFDWELYEVFAFKPEKSKKKMDRNFFIEKMSQSIEYAKYLMKTFTTLKDNFLSGFIQSYNRNKLVLFIVYMK